jgi:hypothetical protein
MPELDGVRYSRAELLRRTGRLEQVAGVRLVTLGDGVERGVRVLEFRTGSGLSFEVLVDRAFDIGRCEYAGRSLAWSSPTGFVGPWYFEAEEFGFFRSFGAGLLTTCGLDHAFGPEEDTAEQYRYPGKATERYGLHGRISNTPGRLVAYGERWDGDDCTLHAEGEVVQAAVFGEQLLLHRSIEARVGESRLSIRDRVANLGHHPTPHMFLYHVNIGWPIVDEAAELVAPVLDVAPRGDYSADDYQRLGGPVAGFLEQAFEQRLAAETDGLVPVGVVNRAIGLGAYQVFNQRELPYHVVWKMLGEATYVVGIEPSTNRLDGRLGARSRGELIELEAGESRTYSLELGALVGADAIDQFQARTDALRP